MKEFFQKRENRTLIIAGGVIVVILLVWLVTFIVQKATAPTPLEAVSTAEADQQASLQEEPQKILIHVKGAVASPGLVELEKGARIQDAIDAAGGALEDADLNRVNLAQTLSDGQELYIVKYGEAIPAGVNSAGTTSSAGGKVNLNTATEAELDSLPGVGPATAQKIIEYRNQQPFKNTKEITKIRGIGEAAYEEMKDRLEV